MSKLLLCNILTILSRYVALPLHLRPVCSGRNRANVDLHRRSSDKNMRWPGTTQCSLQIETAQLVITQAYVWNGRLSATREKMIWRLTLFAAFHIESLEGNDIIQGVTPPPPSYAIGAPSRPPSRSNNRSPLGNMIDWTAEDAAGSTLLSA